MEPQTSTTMMRASQEFSVRTTNDSVYVYILLIFFLGLDIAHFIFLHLCMSVVCVQSYSQNRDQVSHLRRAQAIFSNKLSYWVIQKPMSHSIRPSWCTRESGTFSESMPSHTHILHIFPRTVPEVSLVSAMSQALESCRWQTPLCRQVAHTSALRWLVLTWD